MQSLLENPAVQAGVVPFVAALLVAAAAARTRFAWIAIAIAYASMLAVSTGISFSPLSASRKVQLLVFLAPVVGLAIDLYPRRVRYAALSLALSLAALTIWTFWSVLVQREALTALLLSSAGLAVVAMALVGCTSLLRDDGVATAAAGVGLGLATGIGALLSASIGYFMSGIAMAAACGALLLLQFGTGKAIRPGLTGTLSIATSAGLFASASLMLAQLPWTALALTPVIPLTAWAVARAPIASHRLRLVVVALSGTAASAAPLLAAWMATTTTGN